MRALLVIFMVVLIGNPVCCCAVANSPHRSEATSSDLPPCCQARLATRTEGRDSGGEGSPSPQCPCSVKLGFVTAETVSAPAPAPVIGIPAILPAVDLFRPGAGNRSLFGSGCEPGPLIEASQPPPRLLYGVFRC